jgi:hypothetical protein
MATTSAHRRLSRNCLVDIPAAGAGGGSTPPRGASQITLPDAGDGLADGGRMMREIIDHQHWPA